MVPTLRHVLVIGVDGVRFDLLGPELTPVIWGFTRSGFLGPVPVDQTTPTWSGPCWATIATGTGVAGHGITGNDLTGHRLAEHPDFVTVATRAGVSTLLAVSGWPPLALAEDGGPLFAEATRREFVAASEVSLDAWDAADEAVTSLAASIVAGEGRGCRSSTWARWTWWGMCWARVRPTGRRRGRPTSGWGGCWPRSGRARAWRTRRGRRSWAPTTGTWTGGGTGGRAPAG